MPFAKIKPSARRWLRRKRAKARLSWYLHTRRIVPLTLEQLSGLYHILSTHHSKDVAFLGRIQAEMAEIAWLPWICPCGRRNSKTSGFCGACGKEWHASYSETGAATDTPWPRSAAWGGDWAEHGQGAGTASPRRRPSRGRHRNDQGKGGRAGRAPGNGRGRGQGKGGQPGHGSGKGHGAGKGQIPGVGSGKGQGAPSTPAAPATEPAWAAPAAAPPREALQNEQAIRNLLSTLTKNSEILTPELQEALSTVGVIEQKNNGKIMHTAVSKWTKAQSQHAAALKARATLHTAWRNFVQEAVQRWESYAADFSSQDQELQTAIHTTKDTLTAALTELEAANAQVSRASGTSSADATMTPEAADTVNVENEAQRLDQASARISESLTTMVTQLGSVRRRSEDVIDLEAPPPAQRARADGEAEPFVSPGA